MRIAFFGDANYVGAHEWIEYLSREEGFEVHSIVFPGHEHPIPGVVSHRLEGRFPEGKLRYFLCVPALKRAVRRISPDLLIGYRVVSYGLSAALTGFHPLVLAAQGMFIASRATPRLSRAFARRALASADLLHSWAPIMTENMLKLGADPERIMTLTRGVDDRAFSLGAPPPAPLTLATTRQLEAYYNFPTLLDAIDRVRAEVPDVRYRIAGKGSRRGELEAIVRARSLGENVEFLGPVSKERLPDLLRRSHLYVAAVPSDGTSSSMLEAMAAGAIPIVADNESNRHWVKDREGGRLLPPFDARSYAAAIVEAWRDERWRLAARPANRRLVETRASWHRNMALFVSTYRELVAGSRRIPEVARFRADAP
ncbi:MAG: glycosyltransferase family 4 protein [Acidobacteria bacterium]|nr:glycosyltransferase family 4 protein [Acidobacteriota bacterium]